MKKFNEGIPPLHDAITNHYKMESPNEQISIHEGLFFLTAGNATIELNGKVFFGWYPKKGLRFVGVAIERDIKSYIIISASLNVTLRIGDEDIENCIVEDFNDIDFKFQGRFKNSVIKGDKTINVERVNFSMVNLKPISHGLLKNKNLSYRKRITLESKDYIVNIDKDSNYDSLLKALCQSGGYQVLFHGEILRKNNKKTFKHEEAIEIIRSVGVFLSFVNGAKINPILISGVSANQINWSDFSATNNEPFEEQCWNNWTPIDFGEEVNNLWEEFQNIWFANKDDQYFLEFVIHWYLESNSSKSYIYLTPPSFVHYQRAEN